MGWKYFDLIDFQFVKVRFICSRCNTKLVSEKIEIPDIDQLVEDGNLYSINSEEKNCPKCNEYFIIHVGLNLDENIDQEVGSYIEIDNLNKESILEAITYEFDSYSYEENYIDSILKSENSFKVFNKELNNLKELNSITFEKDNHQIIVRRLIYSGAIACLEDYLSSTLIKEVIQDERYFKNFVKTYKRIKVRKFELGDIYHHLDKLYDIVRKELTDVIYHDLPKVKGMYKDTLEINFPSIKILMKNIQTRHNIVHRNGKTKGGELILIEKEDINLHLKEISNFVTIIEKQIEKLN